MKKLHFKLFLVLILFIANSCKLDSFDFNKLSDDVGLTPEFVLPLAHANITVWDIMESVNDENDTLIKKGADDVIKIVYTEEGIYDYNVKDLLDLPIQKSLSTGNLAIGNISVNDIDKERVITLKELTDVIDGDIDQIVPLDGTDAVFPSTTFVSDPSVQFEVEDIDNFEWIRFSKGDIEITLENMLPVPISLMGGFYDDMAPFAGFNFTSLDPKEISTITVPLDGKSISNKIDFRMRRFETISDGQTSLIDLYDYFKLSIKFKNIEISEGYVKPIAQTISGFSGSFDFDFDDGIEAFKAKIKEGSLGISSTKISATNSFSINGSVNITFPSILKNGSAIEVTVPFGSSANPVGLANAEINLASDLSVPYNKVPYEYSITVNGSDTGIPFNATDAISLTVDLMDLEFKSIEGDFGERNVLLNGNFNMDTEILDKISGDFNLANPVLQLVLTNGIGVPAQVNAQFSATNNSGQSVSLNPEPFRLATPANSESDAVMQTITFDKTNSNIVDFIALPPSGNISYSGNIVFNPDGAVSAGNPNFFDLDASLKIDVGLELPLELEIKNLTFSDTVEIDGGDLDMVTTAELIINAENEIPLDIDVQFFFIDTISGNQYGESKLSRLLDAAQIDGNGVITPANSNNSITLDETELDDLKKANGIVIKGNISSSGGESKGAKIYSQSKLNITVGIKSKIEL